MMLTIPCIVTKIYQVDQPMKPLENYRDIDSFKIYVSDVGLLCAKKEIVPEDIHIATTIGPQSVVQKLISKPQYAIKLSTRNFGFEDGKKTVPLYAAFCV